MNTTNRYRYEMPIRATVVGVLFYLGISAVIMYFALTWTNGPHVGFIALSSILALATLVRRLVFPCTLELTDDAILLPRGHVWLQITTIPFEDVISIKDYGKSLSIDTGMGTFEIAWLFEFEGYPTVREIISVRTAITLEPLRGTDSVPKVDSDELPIPSLQRPSPFVELPEPLVEFVEPEIWPGFRRRAEVTKPILYQLRTELRFFVRCYEFCCAFIVVPFLGFVLLPWLYLEGPFELVDVCLSSFGTVSFLAIFLTMYHWLNVIDSVSPEIKISFRDRGITALLINGQKFHWNYREFCGWTVIERRFKEHVLQILVVKRLVKGRAYNHQFALPDAGIRDQVIQILNDRQIPQESDLKPSWEV